jgi:outer membrane protein assembly factor BamB
VTSAAIEPAVAGGLVFHVARSAGEDTLYVLKVRTGEEKGTWSAPAGKTVTSLVASYDDATSPIYRVYVGASDGRIYALEGADKEEGSFLVDLWQSSSASADVVAKGTTHLVMSADKTKLIVGSESGVFILDVATGQIQRRVTSHVPVTSDPAYSDATGDLWIASDQVVWRIPASGSECFYDVKERVTTDLVPNARGTALFFGTETGSVYAMNPTTCAKIDDIRPLRSVAGIAVVSRDDDAVVFLTSAIGEAAREEYDHGRRGFTDNQEQISERTVEPDSIVGAPAILPNNNVDDALVVFVAGERREGRTTRPILLAWDRDLQNYETVTVWGDTIPFLFKPEEEGTAPDALLRPIVDPETSTLLVASSDGYLYAFDLSEFK